MLSREGADSVGDCGAIGRRGWPGHRAFGRTPVLRRAMPGHDGGGARCHPFHPRGPAEGRCGTRNEVCTPKILYKYVITRAIQAATASGVGKLQKKAPKGLKWFHAELK